MQTQLSARPSAPPPSRPGRQRIGRALPAYARTQNRAAVLTTLLHDGGMSRADLARLTGLTRVTVSDLIAELLAAGLVLERGIRKASGPGKPATLVDVNRRGTQIVAVDLSEDGSFRAALTDLTGDILVRRTVAWPATPGDLVEAVDGLAEDMLAQATERVLGIGVAVGGVVAQDGSAVSSNGLGGIEQPIQERLRDRLGLPVHVGGGADASALAERTYGGAMDDAIVITVGTGVGAGVLARGKLARRGRGSSGEIGHVTVVDGGGLRCLCGKRGCLAAWLSIGAMEDRIGAGAEPADVYREAGRRLGSVLAPIASAIDLSEIVLCGPAKHLDGALRESTARALHARVPMCSPAVVRVSTQGADAVLRGAGVLVLDGELGVT